MSDTSRVLDEKALEAATAAYNEQIYCSDKEHAARIVTAYLSALSSAPFDDGWAALDRVIGLIDAYSSTELRGLSEHEAVQEARTALRRRPRP